MPVQVRCMILDAWGWCTGTTQGDGMGREEGGVPQASGSGKAILSLLFFGLHFLLIRALLILQLESFFPLL